MKAGAGLKRLLKDERGFSLPELLVTMLMMLTVMFALYSIFDMSLRVFSFGNDKVEAVENARLGLERMEREIRAAYPVEDELVVTSESGEISFYNNIGTGNSGAIQITYEMYDSSAGEALGRAEGDGNNEAVSQFVKDLEFDYLDRNGDETDEEPEIHRVEISLTVEVEDGTQELTTQVYLRNRTGGDE